jgi:ABC-type nitrate/sulfonate/bicarbonate transport system permease component
MPESLAPRLIGPAFLGLLLLGWEAAVQAGLVTRSLLPPPSLVAEALAQLLLSGAVAAPLLHTITHLAVGFVIGGALGMALGVLMGSLAWLHDLLEPLVELLRPLPKSALLPALVLFLGLGATMQVSAVALGVLFPVLVATIQGVRGVDPVLLDTARSLRVPRLRVLLGVVLPAAAPHVLAGLRVALGLGLVLVTLSEMLAGSGGIGFAILDTQRSFRVRQMYAWIVVLALLGLALNTVFVALEHRLLHWQHATQGPRQEGQAP